MKPKMSLYEVRIRTFLFIRRTLYVYSLSAWQAATLAMELCSGKVVSALPVDSDDAAALEEVIGPQYEPCCVVPAIPPLIPDIRLVSPRKSLSNGQKKCCKDQM